MCFIGSIFCKYTNKFSISKKKYIFIQKGGNIFQYQWHQSTFPTSDLRYSTGGVVGSGIMVFNLHICSRSSIKLFENSSVGGTKNDNMHCICRFFYPCALLFEKTMPHSGRRAYKLSCPNVPNKCTKAVFLLIFEE